MSSSGDDYDPQHHVRLVKCTSAMQAYRAAHAVNESRVIARWMPNTIDENLRMLEMAFYVEAERLEGKRPAKTKKRKVRRSS